ncbi:hypothetical protein JY651_09660 [Pyxidicoccus parkwayensis]|uniref:Uncharacterized protein n=1 Tax=Pyxidicoccus parkwayensis TaxID=2813578 RepID=A0ABX7P3X4_9BACT|nr:hypothetical protein [Pyxidicoccus parkwaysis]QSQ25169.1 hypothetical protein JY651_09660 [Pyxidicoccus parkwaysis]
MFDIAPFPLGGSAASEGEDMTVLILVLAVVGAGVAVFMMSGRKGNSSDVLSLGESAPAAGAPPPSRPANPPTSDEKDPAEELAKTAALHDTRGPAVPKVSSPRLTSLHIIDNVHSFHFVATLGRRLVFVFHPYSPNRLVGVEQGLDEDGSNTGALFDHLAERAIAAGLPDLAAPRAQDAFQPHTLSTSSIHIRALFEDGRRWAGMYGAEELLQQGLPAGLLELLLDMRALGLQMVPEQIKSQGARPPLLHFTLEDKATQPTAKFSVLVDTKEVAMISVPPSEGGRGTTYMIPLSDSRNLVHQLSERIDGLIDLYRVLALTPVQGEQALRQEAVREAAFMARMAIGDGKQFWATFLNEADIARGALPPLLAAFARDVRTLAVATARASEVGQKAAS